MIKKINKNSLTILCFIIPAILILFYINNYSENIWSILSQGKYILKNGIYYTDILSMHKNLDITVQNWLSSTIFGIFYLLLKEKGIILLTLILNTIFCFVLYKLCMLISNKNKILSNLCMLITDIVLILFNYVVLNELIFTFIMLTLLLYLVELYIKTNNKKYLYFIPLVSILEINLDASMWFWIYILLIPYLIDGHKIKFLNTEGYKKLPLVITIVVSILAGFINPYGIKAITFIFNYDNYLIRYGIIEELSMFTIASKNNTLLGIYALFVGLIFIFFREGKIKFRYVLLFIITLILSFYRIKVFPIFILVSLFPVSYFFKDMLKIKKLNFENTLPIKIIDIILLIVLLILLIKPNNLLTHNYKKAVNELDKTAIKGSTVYTEFENGSYLEYRGYKPYIDNRAQVFLKRNNHKKNYLDEFTNLYFGNINPYDFISDYKFDYILVSKNDIMYEIAKSSTSYTLIYKDKYTNLFIKNSLKKTN